MIVDKNTNINEIASNHSDETLYIDILFKVCLDIDILFKGSTTTANPAQVQQKLSNIILQIKNNEYYAEPHKEKLLQYLINNKYDQRLIEIASTTGNILSLQDVLNLFKDTEKYKNFHASKPRKIWPLFRTIARALVYVAKIIVFTSPFLLVLGIAAAIFGMTPVVPIIGIFFGGAMISVGRYLYKNEAQARIRDKQIDNGHDFMALMAEHRNVPLIKEILNHDLMLAAGHVKNAKTLDINQQTLYIALDLLKLMSTDSMFSNLDKVQQQRLFIAIGLELAGAEEKSSFHNILLAAVQMLPEYKNDFKSMLEQQIKSLSKQQIEIAIRVTQSANRPEFAQILKEFLPKAVNVNTANDEEIARKMQEEEDKTNSNATKQPFYKSLPKNANSMLHSGGHIVEDSFTGLEYSSDEEKESLNNSQDDQNAYQGPRMF